MKVGVIGTNWGRVHCGAFRECGFPVDLLIGRDSEKTVRVAEEEGVPRHDTDPEMLEEMDIVVIASPASGRRRWWKWGFFPDAVGQ